MRNVPSLEDQVERAVSDSLANHTGSLVLVAKAQMVASIYSARLARGISCGDIVEATLIAEKIITQLGLG